MSIEVHSFIETETLIDKAAEFILQCAKYAVQTSGRFTFVLAGGNTPRSLHSRLSEPPRKREMEIAPPLPLSEGKSWWGVCLVY